MAPYKNRSCWVDVKRRNNIITPLMLLFRKLKHGARRLTVGLFEERRSIKKISQNSSKNLKVSAKLKKGTTNIGPNKGENTL